MVFLSSTCADDGFNLSLGYSATKGAIGGMMLPMAKDLAPLGINCVAIAPSFFDTPMVSPIPKELVDVFKSRSA
jgi:NAD(P)-dependent dehydrogenase (short-subunit alcohol dehydrogenase family)